MIIYELVYVYDQNSATDGLKPDYSNADLPIEEYYYQILQYINENYLSTIVFFNSNGTIYD